MSNFLLGPSLLSANLASLGDEAEAVLAAGADFLHLDVMDNHYAPNLSFGPGTCSALRNRGIKAIIDVHCMTEKVDSLIVPFANAGASWFNFHLETSPNPKQTISFIKKNGMQAGLVLSLTDPVKLILPYLADLDAVIVMGVALGFSGQLMQAPSLEKLSELCQLKPDLRLIFDGGVNAQNIKAILACGANAIIAGKAVFQGDASAYAERIQQLKSR